jgi:hypothetical protein
MNNFLRCLSSFHEFDRSFLLPFSANPTFLILLFRQMLASTFPNTTFPSMTLLVCKYSLNSLRTAEYFIGKSVYKGNKISRARPPRQSTRRGLISYNDQIGMPGATAARNGAESGRCIIQVCFSQPLMASLADMHLSIKSYLLS